MGNSRNGVWPTMLTPFTETGEIDYNALSYLINWYIEQGVSGLFAICQSSEMFYLGRQEKLDLAKACVSLNNSRVPIIASGNTADSIEEQAEDVIAMAETGVDSVVLLTNRFASDQETDDVWKKRLEKLLVRIPEHIRLGFYECPYPYKRLLSKDTFDWCLSLNRFDFLKDTSCSVDTMQSRLDASRNSSMKIYNANSATLLDFLRAGGAGYSGVMANFHADLYVRLCDYAAENDPDIQKKAEKIQSYLGPASVIELQNYPRNAKYVLSKKDIPITTYCRKDKEKTLQKFQMMELDQFMQLDAYMHKLLI